MRWIERARRARDRGAISIEWVGIVALVLIIVGSVIAATTRLEIPVTATVSNWIQCMAPGQSCSAGDTPNIDTPGVGDGGEGPAIDFDPPDIGDIPGIENPPTIGPGDDHSGGPQIPTIPHLDGPRGDEEVGDPVNTLSGAFVVAVTDVTAPPHATVGSEFTFHRTYSSIRADTGDLGLGWRHSYEMRVDRSSDGEAIVTNEAGERLVFEQDGESFEAPQGVYSTLERTGDGFELARKSGDVIGFDDAGLLQHITDRFGYRTDLSYANGELQTITDGSGREYSFSYTDGLLTEVAHADGRTAEFTYRDGLLTEAVALDGQRTTFAYDDDGRLAESHDAEGHRTVTNTYDEDGRVTHQVDAGGGEWTFEYGNDGVRLFTDPNGETWSHLYRNNLLVAQADPRGNTTLLRYDENSELVGLTDPNGNESTIRRDSVGNAVAVEGPDGTGFNWRMQYDDDHNVTQVLNPSNHAINFTYDATGALESITDAEGNQTRFEFDADWPGVPVAMIDARGNRTDLTSDELGQLVRVENADGSVITMEYDDQGNIVETVGPLGNVEGSDVVDRTLMEYDAMGRLTRMTDPVGRVSAMEYDGVGNLVRMDNAEGEVTFDYDARGFVTSIMDELGEVASYTYDLLGNVTEMTDGAGVTQELSYDEAGRPSALTDASGTTYQYRHDPNGNIVEALTLPDGSDEPDPNETVMISYDALDQPVRIDYGDDSPPLSIDYTPVGQLREIVSGPSRERYTWTPNGQLDIHDRDGHFFRHTYDATGNLTAQELPDGTEVVMAYDEVNRPVSIESPDQDLDVTYDIAGRVTEAVENHNGGLAHRFAYDVVGNVLETTAEGPEGVLAKQAFNYDDAGRPLQVETLNELYSYAYDARGSLLEATRENATSGLVLDSFAFTYDDAGRRIAEAAGSEHREFSYDDAGRLESVADADGATALTYDAHGNVVSVGDHEYEYDANGYLVGAVTPDGHARYERDVLGRVIASTVQATDHQTSSAGGPDTAAVAVPASATADAGGPSQLESWWNPAGGDASPALITDEASGETTRFGTGGATQERGGDVLRLLPDHFGSTAAAVDTSGNIAESFAYSPFGSTTASDGDSEAMPRFAGQVPDGLTGTYQFDGQTYDADLGAFLHAPAGPGPADQVPATPMDLAGQAPAASQDGAASAETEGALAPQALPVIAIPAIGAIFKAIGVGALISGVVSTITQLVSGDFSVKNLLIDMLIGGLTGGIGKFFNVTKFLHNLGIFAAIGTIADGIKQFLKDGSVNVIDAVLNGLFDGALRGIFKSVEKWIPEHINKYLDRFMEGLPSLTDIGRTIVSAVIKSPVVEGVKWVGCRVASLWGGCADPPDVPSPELK